ncbi:MAG: type II secretion system protein GspG [Lentisphaerae bacterium]|nr:type II secretion system protein GspG [Lentisphaerota bacterium]
MRHHTQRFSRPLNGSHRSQRQAFTLIELLTVIAIIALVMGLVVGAGRFARLKAIESKGRAGLEHIANALNEYSLKNGVYPSTLVSIVGFLPPGVVTLDGAQNPIDPWGRPYQYSPGPSNRSFTLYSTGRLEDPSDPDKSADDLYPGK